MSPTANEIQDTSNRLVASISKYMVWKNNLDDLLESLVEIENESESTYFKRTQKRIDENQTIVATQKQEIKQALSELNKWAENL